jgi:Type IV secretion system pilin
MKRPSWKLDARLYSLLSLPTPLYDNSKPTNPSVEQTPAALANHIVNLMLAFVVPIAVVAIFWSAWILLTSQGDPAVYAKVKKNVINIVLGAMLIVFAVKIFNFVYSFFN